MVTDDQASSQLFYAPRFRLPPRPQNTYIPGRLWAEGALVTCLVASQATRNGPA